jgi:hypothetical protein
MDGGRIGMKKKIKKLGNNLLEGLTNACNTFI